MADVKCPGQDTRYWKKGDIFDVRCPNCGKEVEFFKDEVRRSCRCGHVIVNPKIDFACAEWCRYAEQCLGELPAELKAKKAEGKSEEKTKGKKASLRIRISQEMQKYFGDDFRRIHHALKVARYAERILKMEGGDPLVVLGAAYLHDIGIHEAERKYQSLEGHLQEKEGPPIAREILEKLGVGSKLVDEICDIIGHHHYPRKEETLNFQIVYEADGLVNIEEMGIANDPERVRRLIEEAFRTVTGKKLAEELALRK